MKHTLSVLVEDEAGVLTRIAGLFARRGKNQDQERYENQTLQDIYNDDSE